MSESRGIAEAVKYLAGTHQTDTVFLIDAQVLSVDPDAMTCVVTALTGPVGNDIPDVRLIASVDDGVLRLPTIGSTVTVLMSTFTDPAIVAYSGLDKIVLLGGDLGGLPVVGNLIIRLNNLENAYNDLASKYNSHVHPVIATGSPTGTTSILEPTNLALTVATDIENPNITQG